MKCIKCKKIVPGNKSVCPHCGSQLIKKSSASTKGASNKYIKENGADLVGSTVTKTKGSMARLDKPKQTTVRYRNTNKGSKNKYLTEDNSSLVGGAVSKNNGSFVKLEKKPSKKKIQSIERKDFNNYIDYKEAKENQEAQIRSINELRNVSKFDESDLSSKVVTTDKVRGSSKVGLASLKERGAADAAKMGAKTVSKFDNSLIKIARENKNKPQPMRQEDYQRQNVTVPNVEIVEVSVEKQKRKRNFKLETNALSYSIVVALWIVAIVVLISSSNNSFYFSQNQSFTSTAVDDDAFTDYRGVSKSGQTGGSSSEGYTSVVYDNQYLAQFTIRTEQDVYNLISTDSKKQKANCPNNIKEIEETIVNNYGITAVNLCEMDEDFALELVSVVKYIYQEFPNARNYLTNLTLANVGDENSFIAAFMPIFTFSTSNSTSGYPVATKTQIILNAKYFLNNEKIKNSVSYGSKSGYFPPNATRSSTVAHEFGHYLSYVALLNYYETDQLNYVRATETSLLYDVYDDFNAGNFSKILLEEAFDDYVAETGSTESFYEFRASISQYAIAKDSSGLYIYDETIAEAFHDYYLNGSNAKPASLAIVEVLKSKL